MVDIPSDSTVETIQLDNGKRSRRLLRVAHSLHLGSDGWANGTMKLDAKDLDVLFKSDLFANVALSNGVKLSGRIHHHALVQAHESVSPVLLKSADEDVAGIAWADIDNSCNFNYQVRVSADLEPATSESRLILQDFPMSSLKTAAMMPGRTLELESGFRGSSVEGSADRIHKLTMARMDAGDASLTVLGPEFRIEGRLTDIRAPMDCLPRYARNELELMPGYLSDLGEERPEMENELATRCFYEGGVYDDGAQWEATHQPCKMCSCQRGKVVCDPIVCPATHCDAPIIPEGSCCPTCASVDTLHDERGCYFGSDKFHKAGAKWHPYIPPFGFSRCATCTCHADSLRVTCEKTSCPRLDCPKDRQEIPDPFTCCPICKPAPSTPAPPQGDPDRPHDMAAPSSKEDVLRSGGCSFHDEVKRNGEKWHPRLRPSGVEQCVMCTCKVRN